MAVTPIFAIGAPSGTPSAMTLQPSRVRPLRNQMAGNRASGIVQHGRNAIQVFWTASLEGESVISDVSFAEINTQYVASKSTAGERHIVWWDPDASSGSGGASGNVKCLMDPPEWQMDATGALTGVVVVFRDMGRP